MHLQLYSCRYIYIPQRLQPSFLYGQITFVTNPFEIPRGGIQVGHGRLFLIAGPCVIESEQHARMMADSIQRITSDLGVPYIFKASYDKANRTSIHSFRGPGLAEGTRILRAIGPSIVAARTIKW